MVLSLPILQRKKSNAKPMATTGTVRTASKSQLILPGAHQILPLAISRSAQHTAIIGTVQMESKSPLIHQASLRAGLRETLKGNVKPTTTTGIVQMASKSHRILLVARLTHQPRAQKNVKLMVITGTALKEYPPQTLHRVKSPQAMAKTQRSVSLTMTTGIAPKVSRSLLTLPMAPLTPQMTKSVKRMEIIGIALKAYLSLNMLQERTPAKSALLTAITGIVQRVLKSPKVLQMRNMEVAQKNVSRMAIIGIVRKVYLSLLPLHLAARRLPRLRFILALVVSRKSIALLLSA